MEKRKDSRGRVLKTGETQRKDGRYAYTYTDIDGKRKTVYSWRLVDTDRPPAGKKSDDCLRKMEKDIQNSRNSGIRSERCTLDDLFKDFLKAVSTMSPNTIAGYVCSYNAHFKKELGNMPVCDIKYSDVRKIYTEMSTSGKYKDSTIRTMMTRLASVFNYAMRNDLTRHNYAEEVLSDAGKQRNDRKNKRQPLSIEQQSALLEFVRNSDKFKKFDNIITFLLGTGCRIGEASAITIDDCDFKNGIIHINKALVRDLYGKKGTEYHITTPKTANGIRDIPMMDAVRRALQSEIDKTMLARTKNPSVDGVKGFIFLGFQYDILKSDYFYGVLKNIREQYNKKSVEEAAKTGREPVLIPVLSAHIFRHTFCTRFCENETDLKIIQEIMGHSSASTTMDIYNEASLDRKIKSMGDMSRKILL